jgi:5-methylcytosine-specific restriction endonuclease McrA
MSGARVSTWLAQMVRKRAQQRCEYCLMPQVTEDAVFHIDHVKPRALKGASEFDNLALACVTCSLKKGMKTGGIDPSSKRRADFFNSRRNRWG